MKIFLASVEREGNVGASYYLNWHEKPEFTDKFGTAQIGARKRPDPPLYSPGFHPGLSGSLEPRNSRCSPAGKTPAPHRRIEETVATNVPEVDLDDSPGKCLVECCGGLALPEKVKLDATGSSSCGHFSPQPTAKRIDPGASYWPADARLTLGGWVKPCQACEWIRVPRANVETVKRSDRTVGATQEGACP